MCEELVSLKTTHKTWNNELDSKSLMFFSPSKFRNDREKEDGCVYCNQTDSQTV